MISHSNKGTTSLYMHRDGYKMNPTTANNSQPNCEGKFPQLFTILFSLLWLSHWAAQESQFSIILIKTGLILITWCWVQMSWQFLPLFFFCNLLWSLFWTWVFHSLLYYILVSHTACVKWTLYSDNIIASWVSWSYSGWVISLRMKKPSHPHSKCDCSPKERQENLS